MVSELQWLATDGQKPSSTELIAGTACHEEMSEQGHRTADSSVGVHRGLVVIRSP